ncbi:VOC family protein [Rhodovibrionaceae bacterium A322]
MVSKRNNDPWMSADDYGRSLNGLGINLLVPDMEKALHFQTEVLQADVVYSDPDFAVLRGYGAEWMLHADHTYSDHPLSGSLTGEDAQGMIRGLGLEIRLHGCDPDAAEARARKAGYTVLAGALDKPHGLREAYLVDADGYLWVPDMPLPKET